jgi:hypothetical protein
MSKRFKRSGTAGVSFFAFQDIITSVTGILVLITVLLTFFIKEGAAQRQAASAANPQMKLTLEELLAMLEKLKLQADANAKAGLPDPKTLETKISLLKEDLKFWEDFRGRHPPVSKDAPLQAVITRNAEEARALGDSYRRNNPVVSARVDALGKEYEEWFRKVKELKEADEKAQQSALILLPPDRSVTDKEPLIASVDAKGISLYQFGGKNESFSGIADFQARLRGFDSTRQYVVFYNKPGGTPIIDACIEAVRKAGFSVGYDGIPDDLSLQLNQPTSPP